ncbi:MAG: TonB-dependent receptor [Longimicrobiales bacterium]
MNTACARWACTALILLWSSSAALHAQTGSVSGTVTSRTGEPLPNVDVTLLAQARGVAATRTDTAGHYALTGIAAGEYSLLFRLTGYAELRAERLTVQENGVLRHDATLEVAPLPLDAITVTAQRRHEKLLDAPASVAIVDGARIAERPALAIFDHIKDVAGLSYIERGLLSRTYIVRGPTNVAPGGGAYTMVDYRIASVPSLGFNVPYLLPSAGEDVERIEVLRGPASALYGPNAISGVVHLLTESPFAAPGTRISVTAGERQTLRAAARHASVLGDNVAFRVSAQYLRGHDWEYRDSLEQRARDFDVEQYAVEARADLRAGVGTDIVLSVGTATAANALEMVANGTYQVRDWRYDYLQARLTRGRLFSQIFFNHNDAGRTIALRTLDAVKDDSRMLVAQVQHGLDVLGSTWTYGLDLQHTDPRTAGTVSGRNEANDAVLELGAYLHAEKRLARRWRVVGAGRIDHHDRMDGLMLSPRAALLFEPTPGHMVRATYNRAYRSPNSLDLFVDLRTGRLNPLPYETWLRASPREGWRFRRDCGGGLCMRSPAAPGTLPLDATRAWPMLVAELRAFGIDLSSIPAPTAADVRTVLRTLDTGAGYFVQTDPAAVRDIAPLERTVASALELGYRGLLRDRLRLDVDAYYARVRGFIRGPFVSTPSAFLETGELGLYLSRYLTAASAQQIAQLIGGIPASRQFPGVPLGTVAPDHPTADYHIIMTYESFGEVDQWGADVTLEALLGRGVSLTGGYSYLQRDGTAPGLGDAPGRPFRVPRTSGSAGLRFSESRGRMNAELRARFAAGYTAYSSLYSGRVEDIRLVDATVGWRVPLPYAPRLTISAQNALDRRTPQELGAPAIGRLLLARLVFDF